MIRITFDSNVWRKIASPEVFQKDPLKTSFRIIHQSIVDKMVLACLSDVIFTLEAIAKCDRKKFFASYQGAIDSLLQVLPNGSISIDFSVKPHPTNQPSNNPYLSAHLDDAIALGFRLLRSNRIAGLINRDLPDSFFIGDRYVPQGHSQDVIGRCQIAIEQRGCGIKHAKEIGEKYAKPGQPWYVGLGEAPDSQDKFIAKAIAEWADADAIASHIGYRNDFFCTLDFGKAGGPDSILSPQNRVWLTSQFGVKFVTPEQLVANL